MLYMYAFFVIYLVPFIMVVLYHLYYWKVNVSVFEKNRVWVSPYECGFLGTAKSENVFSYTYFILMVFFVMFDLEVSLLLKFPYQGVLYNNFFFYFLFLLMLVLGYFFEVQKGYVSWNY